MARVNDPQVNIKPRLINPGGIGKLKGDGHEKLPEQEDIKGRRKICRDNQGPKGVDPAEPVENDEHRDHADSKGDHHGGNQDHKQGVPLRPVNAGKTVSHQGTGDDAA